jgi:cytochrome c
VETHSGRLMIWSDDCGIVSLSPQSIPTGESKFAEYCSGCHQSLLVSGSRIGPSLHGVLNRKAASLEGYPNYSACLRNSSVVWTTEALDGFISSPNQFCPGTTMDFKGVASGRDRAAIIEFLGTSQ